MDGPDRRGVLGGIVTIGTACVSIGIQLGPVSAPKRDALVLRLERLALAPSELVGVAETG
jgi:hypothetical protein